MFLNFTNHSFILYMNRFSVVWYLSSLSTCRQLVPTSIFLIVVLLGNILPIRKPIEIAVGILDYLIIFEMFFEVNYFLSN